MSTPLLLAVAFAIGIVAGLRALTAPMVVSWAARLQWIDVQGTWAAFLGHAVAPWLLTALALGELVADLLPRTPSRKAPPSFILRILSGAFSGAVLAVGSGQAALLGVVAGALGAVAGTLVGYDARTRLVRSLHVKDFVVALPEDAIAVGGGFLLVSLFAH